MAKRRVAVFDIDGTIVRSSLLIMLVDQLIRDGVFPEEAQAVYAKQHERWMDREGDYPAYISAVVKAFTKHLEGVPYKVVSDSAKRVVAAQWKHTYRYPRNLIKILKDRGYFLLAISHSPKIILDKFCPRLGFDKSYGSLYELDADENFTGRELDEAIWRDKANIFRRAVDKEYLLLTNSVGMGDTENDIRFLEMVAKPICINPNKNLYADAKKKGWKVVVERKDVIYEIQ